MHDTLIVTCVVLQGLITDYMAKGGLAAIDVYNMRLWKNKRLI